MKTAEASRKKQDQVVNRLQVELDTMKRNNARRLKVVMIAMHSGNYATGVVGTGCCYEG